MSSSVPLPLPEQGHEVSWVQAHLGHLTLEAPEDIAASPTIRGGQVAADAALLAFDVTGYAKRRNEVWPPHRQGASRLSPYIRHGLLPLPRVWRDVSGPSADVRKFRDELLWQEYARHVYARVGTGNAHALRYSVVERTGASADDGWPRDMACMNLSRDSLEDDGWLVNQSRMWLASHWSVRGGHGWRDGEDHFFAHLLDGSRAANRLGWQWTIGAGTGKAYGFSRWQVEKRAPGLCNGCALRSRCPVQSWPDDRDLPPVAADPRLSADDDSDRTAGPAVSTVVGDPAVVWLTAESLGDGDPALTAHPDLPAVFVFDEPLLRRLRLSGKRLVFLTECLAELADDRDLRLHLGDPVEEMSGTRLATTYAPVPGWRRRAGQLDVVATYPWPWLARPHAGSVTSYSAWVRKARVLS